MVDFFKTIIFLALLMIGKVVFAYKLQNRIIFYYKYI